MDQRVSLLHSDNDEAVILVRFLLVKDRYSPIT